MPVPCTQTRMHRTQSLHYNQSLRTSLPRYIVVIYRFALRDIVATNSGQTDISARHRQDCTDISLIYRFSICRSVRCFVDISAINRENKARYSSIIVCITFAQYCIIMVLLEGFIWCEQVTVVPKRTWGPLIFISKFKFLL